MSEGNSSKNNTSPTQSPEKTHLTPNNDSSGGIEIGESSSMGSNRTPESNKEKLPEEEAVVVMDEVLDSPEAVVRGEAAEAGTKGGKFKRGRRHWRRLDNFFDSSCYDGSGSKKTSTSNTEQAAEEHVNLEDERMFPMLSPSVGIAAHETEAYQFWQRNTTCKNVASASESQNDASPSKSQIDASFAKSQNDASPCESQNNASPSKLQMSNSDSSIFSSPHSTPRSILPGETTETPSPSAGPAPTLKLNIASPAKSENDASLSKFAHGDQELRELHYVPSLDLARNMQELQMSKSNSSPSSRTYSTRGTMKTPSPSAGPAPTLKLNYASSAKSQNDASPSKSGDADIVPTGYAADNSLPDHLYPDFPDLEGIAVTLPSGASPTREAVDEHIDKVL